MSRIILEPLTAEAFAPFGDVLELPAGPGRQYYESSLGNLRPHARASVSTVTCAPAPGLPLEIAMLERHAHSSQTFVPMDVDSWVVMVAPHAPGGGPDAAGLRAFLAHAEQGITYRPDTWHHGLTVLGRTAHFAIFMWRDGTSGDEEFVPIPATRIEAA